jgi:hypothetical protein
MRVFVTVPGGFTLLILSSGSAVDIVTGYRLDDQGV